MHRIRSKEGISVLIAIVLVSGLAGLLGRMMAIALPIIQKEFNAGFSVMQWLINASIITVAVFTLISGALSDKYGVKKIFNVGITLFLVGCIWASIAPEILQLIISQALVGFGMVFMLPACLAVINLCFLDEEKAEAIGIWVSVSAFFGVLGLVAGGFLIEFWGWRMTFALISILAAFTLYISYLYIPKISGDATIKIVASNFISLALGLFGLSYSLIYGPQNNWISHDIIASTGIASIGISIFIWNQINSENPLIPRKLLKMSKVNWSNAITFLIYFSLNAIYVFAIVNFQKLYNYSPTQAGLALVPPSLLVALFARLIGKNADKLGHRNLIVTGAISCSIGFFLISSKGIGASYLADFLFPLFLIGLGMAFFVTPLTKGATSVPEEFSGSASAINNTVARISGMVAIASLGSIWSHIYSKQFSRLVTSSSLSKIEIDELLQNEVVLGVVNVPHSFSESNKDLLSNFVNLSIAQGFSTIMIICCVMCAIAALLAVLFLKN